MEYLNEISYRTTMVRTIGKKNGRIYLDYVFSSHDNRFFPMLNRETNPTFLISVGRPLHNLIKIKNTAIKAVIRVDKSEKTRLESWNQNPGIFFYVATSFDRALELAESLALRGDAIVFAPEYIENEAEGILLDYVKQFEKNVA